MKSCHEKFQWRLISKVKGEDTEFSESIFFWDW